MKKFILILLAVTMLSMPVMAKNVKVEAMSDFSTANPPQTWKLQVAEAFMGKNGFYVMKGSIIEGKITDVTEPKRMKRNATFTFVPTKFYDTYGNIYSIHDDVVGKYSALSGVSAGGVAKEGAILVGNKLVDGFFGPGVALVEGAVKNNHGNRAKSAVVSVYESTPLSYVNKGKDIEIPKGKVFIMSFKELSDDRANQPPNYSYEPAEAE